MTNIWQSYWLWQNKGFDFYYLFFFTLQLFQIFQITRWRSSRTPWRLIPPTTTLCSQPTLLRTNRKEKQQAWQRPRYKTVRRNHKLLNFILGVNTFDQGAYINHYLTYFILFCLFVFYLGVSLYNLLTVTGLIFFHFVVFMPPQLKHWGSSYWGTWKKMVGVTIQTTRPLMRRPMRGARSPKDNSMSLWRRAPTSAPTNGRQSLRRSCHLKLSGPVSRSWGKVTDQIKKSFQIVLFDSSAGLAGHSEVMQFSNANVKVIKHKAVSLEVNIWCDWLNSEWIQLTVLSVFGFNLGVFDGCLFFACFSTLGEALFCFLRLFLLFFCLLAPHNTTTHWSTSPSLFFTAFSFTYKPLFSLSHVYLLCIAVVAGPSSSSSVPDDITDDVTLPSDQSSKPRGKATEQGNKDYR